jgi:uncharacterized membrane protein YfcA
MYSLLGTAVLLFVAAALATPSGIGGGLLFVPILEIFLDMLPKSAAALSQALIAGASIASLGFSVVEQLRTREYVVVRKLVYLFLPAIIAGSTLGVLVARMIPGFLQLLLLVLICLIASFTIFRRAKLTWRKENELRDMSSAQATAGTHSPGSTGSSGQSEGRKYFVLGIYALTLTAVNILFVFLRGSATAQAIAGVAFCSAGYWTIYAAQFVLFLGIAVGVALVEDGRSLGLVGLVLVTGILGTISGIGGGIVLNPVMLEMGVSPKQTSATAIVMITAMSITATIDYTVSGLIEPMWLLALAADTLTGSVVGMTLIDYVIRKTGRQSVIVFSLGALVAVGGLLALGLGIRDFVATVKQGKNPLEFHSPC